MIPACLFINGTRGATNPVPGISLNANGTIAVVDGGGISFSATSDGVTKTSELFDDYEEGTWTPVINDSTPSTQAGRYTKIGRKVFITWCYGTSNRTNAAVDLKLTGFPFSPTDINSFGGGLTVRNAVDGSDQLTLSYDGSITGIKFKKQTNNANASNLQLDEVAVGYSLFGWAMYDA